MGILVKAFSIRKHSHIGWVISIAALLYILIAQRSLVQTQPISLIGVFPVSAANATGQSGNEFAADGERSFVMDENEGLLWMNDRAIRRALPIYGYPYIENKRYFILRPDQQGVTEINGNGAFLWSLEFGTPITASSVSASFSAWGLLDGSIKVLDGEGRILNELKPSSSEAAAKYGCVYSVAVSSNGETIATVYGIDPQYFLIYAKSGDRYRLASSRKLEKQVRNVQALVFSGSGDFVIGRTADGLALYDVAKKKSKIVHPRLFAGEAELQIKPFRKDGFAFLLAKGDERFSGLIRNGAIEALFPVDGTVSSISVEGSGILLASKDWEYRYKVSTR